MRVCLYCATSLEGTHHNKKYCDTSCYDKVRYRRTGVRSTKAQIKEAYKNRCNRKGYREKLRADGVSRYREVQEYLRAYKVSLGCFDCGYQNHHAALEFDHILGNKELNVCNAKSINQAKKEIEKCQVVCSNCHKIRTFNRLQM